MLSAKQREMLLSRVSRLSREQIVVELQRCPSRFPIDLTDEWIARQSIEDLRHVFAAVCLQCEHLPQRPGRIPSRPAA